MQVYLKLILSLLLEGTLKKIIPPQQLGVIDAGCIKDVRDGVVDPQRETGGVLTTFGELMNHVGSVPPKVNEARRDGCLSALHDGRNVDGISIGRIGDAALQGFDKSWRPVRPSRNLAGLPKLLGFRIAGSTASQQRQGKEKGNAELRDHELLLQKMSSSKLKEDPFESVSVL